MISHEYLKAAIQYVASTGEFSWRIDTNKVKAGSIAGCVNAKGYQYIGIAGRLYRSNRLAWFYHYGIWPKGQIDHINGNRLDNRIKYLRDVDGATNQRNRKLGNKGSTSKLLGVSFHHPTGKWRAQISFGRKTRHLGLFQTEQEAHDAYKKERRKTK